MLAYEKKKNEGKLPPYLQRHTPAKLKQECVDVFPTRYSDQDAETFRLFFGLGKDAAAYFKSLRDADPDVFKPLNNYLKKSTGGTAERNIHLLAWLIDFEHRPFIPVDAYELANPERDLPTPEKELSPGIPEKSPDIPTPTDTEKPEDQTPVPPNIDRDGNGKFGVPKKFDKAIIAFLATVFVVVSSYITYQILQHNQCMYWDGARYQPIACEQHVDGAVVIARDTFRSAHFKKITNLSVIKRSDIGKVHYAKENNIVTFYTTGGENPEDHRKRLLPMSAHIYEKYVLKNNNYGVGITQTVQH